MTHYTRLITNIEDVVAAITAGRDYCDLSDGWSRWYWYAAQGEW